MHSQNTFVAGKELIVKILSTEYFTWPQFHKQSQTQTQAQLKHLKNLYQKQEGKIHTNNHCQLNDMITISKFDDYDGLILNFS